MTFFPLMFALSCLIISKIQTSMCFRFVYANWGHSFIYLVSVKHQCYSLSKCWANIIRILSSQLCPIAINLEVFNFHSTTVIHRSKIFRGHYSTLYHATSQKIMGRDTHLFYRHNVKESVHLKFKIMLFTCRFHVLDVVLTLYI